MEEEWLVEGIELRGAGRFLLKKKKLGPSSHQLSI